MGTRKASATEIKDSALGAMDDVDTAKMDISLTMSMGMQGTSVEITTHLQGAIDRKNRKMEMTMEVPGANENMEYKMYLVENSLYMNLGSLLPENATGELENFPDWLKFEAQSWETQSRFGMQKELLARAEVERLGEKTVEGEECTGLRIKPTEAYWDYVENMIRQGGLTSNSGLPTSGSLIDENTMEAVENIRNAIENMSMTGWYSKDSGLPIKVQLQMGIDMKGLEREEPAAPSTVGIDMTMTFSEFNEPLSIELPEGAEKAIPLSVLENNLSTYS